MKRTYLSLFMAVVLLVSLVPVGAWGAVGCIQCRPGDVFYAVFALSEDSERSDGVMARLLLDTDIFAVVPGIDLVGADGFSILNGRPAMLLLKVGKYAPAGEYTIEASVVEAVDADGTRHENVRIEPVRVVVESASAKDEAAAEKAGLEQRLAEIEAALTEAEAGRTAAQTELQKVQEQLDLLQSENVSLQNQNTSLQSQNASLQNQVVTLTAEKNELEYNQAEALYEAGDYEGAKALYQKLNGYRNAASKVKECEEADAARSRREAFQPGKYVTFGRYPQTEAGNDQTPIEWLVLEVRGNKALLLSRYGLDAKPYNTEKTDATWERCTLRGWLNQEFLNKAFSSTEQKAILTTNVDNSRSQGYSEWSTSGGNNTQDKIFLLSYAEAHQYFAVEHYSYYKDSTGKYNYTNVTSRVSPTAYAIRNGAYTRSKYQTAEGEPAGRWWLRSPGSIQDAAAYVYAGGSLYDDYVYSGSGCVRPALWINLESGIF